MTQRKRQRQCLYIELGLLDEIRAEAHRQDRSLSWIVQRAWAAGRRQLSEMPGANDYHTPAKDEQCEDADATPNLTVTKAT
ncbi:MAG: putative small protein (TIGR04563 family) [Bradymonadia bacterium]|jgi:uncharacterized small protein (TIGR04563 family)